MGAFFGLLGILGVYGLYKAIDGIDTARSKARGGFTQEQIHNIAHSGNSKDAKKLANHYRHGGTGTLKPTTHYRGGFTQEQIRNIAHAGNSKNAKRLARQYRSGWF